jgi:hypothetical protein
MESQVSREIHEQGSCWIGLLQIGVGFGRFGFGCDGTYETQEGPYFVDCSFYKKIKLRREEEG